MLNESRSNYTKVYSIRSPAGMMWITLPAASQYSQYGQGARGSTHQNTRVCQQIEVH